MGSLSGKHILIIVENLPLPFDRRVWQEANTLRSEGAGVSIICPRMKGYTKKYEVINDIHIYRHYLPLEGKGAFGYLAEYSTALFFWFCLSLKIYTKRRFHVIQGCNPPDLIFLVALFYKLFGVKYVFDHHDINPELYLAKFGKKSVFYHFMVFLERLTFMTANFSIATNDSYREIAIRRGKMNPEKVDVVRSGPGLDRLKIKDGKDKFKKGKKYLIGYVGVIGEQEGLDLLLESVKTILGIRNDVQFAIVGGGTELEKIKSMAKTMGVSDSVDFYGRVDDELMTDILNTADVCVNPDRPTLMNNLSTMNKIMEYMALKKPVVQFDLKEGKYSAREASLYAKNTSPEDFAMKIIWLLDHPEERVKMGEFGYQRVVHELSWDHESRKLVSLYARIFK
jgi:glycosyltransferase involved in cell wall biosynthesis